MIPRFARLSLLWKILLSTSVALTAMFAALGWIVQDHVVSATSRTLEEEVRASLESYESLWRSRADKLASVSLILSTMSDVRAAFGTGDLATIRDTAGELWAMLRGMTAPESATAQGRSVFTCRTRRKRIMAKLSASSSLEVVAVVLGHRRMTL